MKKKLFGLLLLLVASVFVLFACSASSSESLNGTWYEYFKAGDGSMQVVESDFQTVFVDGENITYQNGKYTIDKTNKRINKEDGSDSFDYNLDGDILEFDKKTFVRKDSAKYKKLIEDGAEIQGKD